MSLLELVPRLHSKGRRWLGLARRAPVVVLLGVNPLSDGGGGKRPAMLARELVRRGHAVLHLFAMPRNESVDLGLEGPEGVLELDVRRARLDGLLAALFAGASPPWGLVEVPTRDHLRIATLLRSRGARVVYDCIDAWQGSLGEGWYDAAVEDRLASDADLLIGSAEPLLDRLQARIGRRGVLLPNAVDSDRFDPNRGYARPAELPADGPIVIYTGALWGDWMDWSLVRSLAASLPEARIVMVGDHRGECPAPPANLHFPGLRPHAEMPALLAHSDVAIIPWRVDTTTRATSPLKVYEYLAMALPVVAPELPALCGLAGVTRVGDADAFVAATRRALEGARLPAASAVRREQSWSVRVDVLLDLVAGLRQRAESGSLPRNTEDAPSVS